MTWSLKLKNGDLERSGGQLAKAVNETKMVQDIRCQLLQKMGIDDLHPEFGSLLDGGVAPDGTVRDSFIGMDDKEMVKLLIYNEIQRVISDYQSRQYARAKIDKMRYGKATLTRNEVVAGVQSITVNEKLDALNIVITLISGEKTLQNIELSVTN
jgi:hypothetical protein